jgi:excisionase family DNA binding protein
MTVAEAAGVAEVSRSTVSGWVATGRLPVARAGGRRRIRPADLGAAREAAHAGAVVPAWRRDRRRAGGRLRALREAAGLSQLGLAAAAGLTHEEVSLLELGGGRRGGRPSASWRGRWGRADSVRRPGGAGGGGADGGGGRGAAGGAGGPGPQVAEGRGAGGRDQVSGQWRVPAAAVYELLGSGRMRGRSGRLDPRFRG